MSLQLHELRFGIGAHRCIRAMVIVCVIGSEDSDYSACTDARQGRDGAADALPTASGGAGPPVHSVLSSGRRGLATGWSSAACCPADG